MLTIDLFISSMLIDLEGDIGASFFGAGAPVVNIFKTFFALVDLFCCGLFSLFFSLMKESL